MIVFLFGLVQALIGIRIVLLLADANQGNSIVRFIYDLSAVFVAPFEGILHTNAFGPGSRSLTSRRSSPGRLDDPGGPDHRGNRDHAPRALTRACGTCAMLDRGP